MVNIGVRERVSFKDKLLSQKKNIATQIVPQSVEFKVTSDDVWSRRENGVPTIEFSDHIQDLMAQSLKQSVIVRLLGRTIGYKVLSNKIEDLWKPSHGYRIIDLDNNYYMVKFDDMENYSNALLKGPWSIMGHYLTVHPWNPSFMTNDKDLSAIAAWVRFPGLPIQYYHKSVLRALANLIGKPFEI